MRLASDEITIRVAADTVRLRPILRAALRLERRHGGFEPIVRAIADGNLTVMADVIRESSDRFSDIPGILEAIGSVPSLKSGIEHLAEPLIRHVFALAGFDQEETGEAKAATNAKPMSFAEYHEKLFGIATGWLGWSPAIAWNATPAEIITGYKGKLDMLQAVFGSKADDKQQEPDYRRDDASWAALKFAASSGQNKAA
jgi:hypothetical protein